MGSSEAGSEERERGVALFNGVWKLIESREDDDRMLHMAHASRYAWGEAPECRPQNIARGEWLVLRVCTAATEWRERARAAGDAIADPEDRDHFDEDFATL